MALPAKFRQLPLPKTPTLAIPGSPEKEAVMTERARTGHAVFHPDDVYLVRATDDEAIPQKDAGNGKPLRASIRREMEFFDVDLTDDDPEPSDIDPKESLADRCRRWVREDRELRAKVRERQSLTNSHLSQFETSRTEGRAA